MSTLTLKSYQAAERKVAHEEGRRGLAIHAAIAAAVSVLVVLLNVTVASEFPWAIFPIIGMGIGLYVHWYFGVAKSEELMHRHQAEIEHRASA